MDCTDVSDINGTAVSDFLKPAYACDEKTKDGYVRVTVRIRGLTVSNKLKFSRFVPKLTRKPENATIDVSFSERSFSLTVHGTTGGMKCRSYRLTINRLPHEITPYLCHHQVEKDRILVYLHKAEPESWYPAILNGLEEEECHTDYDDEEEDTEDDSGFLIR